MKHVALDLETLDTKTRSVVVAIGAAVTDDSVESFHLQGLFYRNLDAGAQLGIYRTVSPTAMEFWRDPARERAWNMLHVNVIPPEEAVAAFINFVRSNSLENACVWGNGSDFDIGILSSLFEDLGATWPFSYRNHRDLRTLKHLTAWSPIWDAPFVGTQHNALDDAKHQAQLIYNGLNEARRHV